MNIVEASTYLAQAELYLEDETEWYCGLDNRNDRLPVLFARGCSENVVDLAHEFNFVTNDRDAMLTWMCALTTRDRLSVHLANYDTSIEEGDLTAALAHADLVIDLAKAWAVLPGTVVVEDRAVLNTGVTLDDDEP